MTPFYSSVSAQQKQLNQAVSAGMNQFDPSVSAQPKSGAGHAGMKTRIQDAGIRIQVHARCACIMKFRASAKVECHLG